MVLGSLLSRVNLSELNGRRKRNELEYPVHWWDVLGVSPQDAMNFSHGRVEVDVDICTKLGRRRKVGVEVVSPEESQGNNIEETGSSPLLFRCWHDELLQGLVW